MCMLNHRWKWVSGHETTQELTRSLSCAKLTSRSVLDMISIHVKWLDLQQDLIPNILKTQHRQPLSSGISDYLLSKEESEAGNARTHMGWKLISCFIFTVNGLS